MTRIPPKGATERQRDFVINEVETRVTALEAGGGGGSGPLEIDGGVANTNFGTTTGIDGGSA